MNNQSRFRIWDKNNKSWVDQLKYPESMLKLDFRAIGTVNTIFEFYARPEFVMVCSTGMQDINGREIFEGYFVKGDNVLWNRISEVIWVKEYNGFGLMNQVGIDPFYSHLDSNLEIIGNRYEHPNLLNNAQIPHS